MSEGQVLIVGGGPVGLTLALALARAGVHSVVLEAREHPPPEHETRALTWLPRGVELRLVEQHLLPVWQELERRVQEHWPDITAEKRRLHLAALLGELLFLRNARPVLEALHEMRSRRQLEGGSGTLETGDGRTVVTLPSP